MKNKNLAIKKIILILTNLYLNIKKVKLLLITRNYLKKVFFNYKKKYINNYIKNRIFYYKNIINIK